MFHRHLTTRLLSVATCGAALTLAAAPAQAKEGKESKRAACAPAYSAYKTAVERQQAGHMREARDLLSQCMQATSCGGLVPKCRALFDKLGADMPSVIPVVSDESGAPRVDVQVKVDGEPLCSQLDGKAIPVDPGVHEFSFATGGNVFATEKVLVIEGQRNRPVALTIHTGARKADAVVAATPAASPAPEAAPVAEAPAPSDKAPAEATDTASHGDKTAATDEASGGAAAAAPAAPLVHRSRGPLPYILGGLGIAGVAGGGVLTYWGKKDNDALGSCNPHCAPSAIDHIRTMYIAADVSFGVGIAALGAAAILFARPTTEAPKPQSALFQISPTRSGGFASISGQF